MSSQSRERVNPSEDILKQLVNYDVTILMDDSSSMRGGYWRQAGEVMKGVVIEAARYDKDGIQICFLNDRAKKDVKTVEQVERLFQKVQPDGYTPLGKRLDELCKKYLRDFKSVWKSNKRCLIIVITDGAPDKKSSVYDAIKSVAKKLDRLGAPRAQLGIQFVQIGSDKAATKFLNELDNGLKGNGTDQLQRDIVDTTPYSGSDLTSEDLVKILAGAINRRVDGWTETSS